MSEISGYEIKEDKVILRVRTGNKEEVINCQVGSGFFDILGKEAGLNLLFDIATAYW